MSRKGHLVKKLTPDQFAKQLKELKKNTKKLQGRKTVPVEELLTTDFLRSNTRFKSLEDILNLIGSSDCNQSEFDRISTETKDEVVKKHSNFTSWEEMMHHAVAEYTHRQLGFH